MFGVVGITHASGVPTIVGAEENDEPASVLFSFRLSCQNIEHSAELRSSKDDRISLTSGTMYLSQQYTDKGEN